MSPAIKIPTDWTDWRDGFDWETRKPRGRSIKTRGILKAQHENRTWFQLHYRCEYTEVAPFADALIRKTLVLVEEYRGKQLVRSEAMEVDFPVPPPTVPATSDDPDTF